MTDTLAKIGLPMSNTVNPVALLKPLMPSIYLRAQIYDPTWTNPNAAVYSEAQIVPAVGSLVRDTDGTPLWVDATDPVTFVPTYSTATVNPSDGDVTSLLDYGNSLLQLYVDQRNPSGVATPDAKCIFLGKSPRFYNLTRYAGTPQATIISQYFDQTGTLQSQQVPLVALDSTNSSWYLPRCNINATLLAGEEIQVTVFDETGTSVYSAKLFVKQSSVINEDVMYSPEIMAMTVSGTQQLANGNFFLYEKQNLGSLGLSVRLQYSDGTTSPNIPVDGTTCVMYGQNDFISSFAGLLQYITIKYFRTSSQNINPLIADPTGEMISVRVPIQVVPGGITTTNKIVPEIQYNSSTSSYVVRYWMYSASGVTKIDVSGYVSISSGTLVTNSSYFGVPQQYAISVDMSQVIPSVYTVPTTYTQLIDITFYPPTSLVRYSFSDATTSPFVYGLDNSTSRRPILNFDSTRGQYFVPSNIFGSAAAFTNSFYSMLNAPYDPTVAQIPQQPTHFVVRNLVSGVLLVAAPIPITSYNVAFNILETTPGSYGTSTVVFEFLNVVSGAQTNTLIGGPVDCYAGTYI